MQNARVAIFEDDDAWLRIAHDFVGNHDVVAEARTRQEALELLGRVATGDLEIDVVLLDARLDSTSRRGEDAQRIFAAMREHERTARIRVIGFSSMLLSAYGIEADADLTKARFLEIGPTIDSFKMDE